MLPNSYSTVVLPYSWGMFQDSPPEWMLETIGWIIPSFIYIMFSSPYIHTLFTLRKCFRLLSGILNLSALLSLLLYFGVISKQTGVSWMQQVAAIVNWISMTATK